MLWAHANIFLNIGVQHFSKSFACKHPIEPNVHSFRDSREFFIWIETNHRFLLQDALRVFNIFHQANSKLSRNTSFSYFVDLHVYISKKNNNEFLANILLFLKIIWNKFIPLYLFIYRFHISLFICRKFHISDKMGKTAKQCGKSKSIGSRKGKSLLPSTSRSTDVYGNLIPLFMF